MDELCNMFNNARLICPDENNTNLVTAFTKTQIYLRGVYVIDGVSVGEHLAETCNRYKEYMKKIPLRGEFKYLNDAVEKFIYASLCGTFDELLRMSYYIDCEILFAIGGCHLET